MYDELYEAIERNLFGFNVTWEQAVDIAVEDLENKYLDEIGEATKEILHDFEMGDIFDEWNH